MHLLADSTGLRLFGPGGWFEDKHGSKRRRAWRMLHLATDADTGHIVASVLTSRDTDDSSQVGPLLDWVAGSVASITGDGAYDQDDVYAGIAARHYYGGHQIGDVAKAGHLKFACAQADFQRPPWSPATYLMA